MFKTLSIIIIAGGFAACASWKPAGSQAIAQEPLPEAACRQDGQQPLDWRVASQATLKETGDGRKLPVKYDTYLVDQQQTEAFFESIRRHNGGSMTLPLPGGLGCHTFDLSPSGTLSAALNAKYPKLVSLKGVSKQDKGSSARVDYDGNQISAQITWNYKVFMIQPWREDDRLYYLVFRAEDTGYERVPFEKPGTGGYKK